MGGVTGREGEDSVSGWGDWEGRGRESGRDYVEPG